MSIEQVLRKIVEKALDENDYAICQSAGFMNWDYCQGDGLKVIVHALLNSEEVEIRMKEKGRLYLPLCNCERCLTKGVKKEGRMDRVETQKFLDDLRVKVLNKTATDEELGRFLDITADLMEELIAVVEKQDAHISSLEKRVEAQGKVVEAAREAVKWGLPVDFNSFEDLKDALREVE